MGQRRNMGDMGRMSSCCPGYGGPFGGGNWVHGALWKRGLLVLEQLGEVVMLALRAIGLVGLPDLGVLVLHGVVGRVVLAPRRLQESK